MALSECCLMIRLLEEDVWQDHTSMLKEFHNKSQYALLEDALNELCSHALYQSRLHGQGHTERTILLAGLLAWQEGLADEDTRLLLLSASYHDVGRVDDSYDTEHGTRSAQALAELTGCTGQELCLLQGAVAAHSRPDSVLQPTVESYAPADLERALRLARLLKDADGLDRVRIRDLDPHFLRHESACRLAPFARFLFDLYLDRGAAAEAFWCPQRRKIVWEEE